MAQFILDVTRVFRYRTKRKLMTGIDRVTMAYIRRYGSDALALVRWLGRTWLLPKAESMHLFSWLLNSNDTSHIPSVFLGALFKPLSCTGPFFLLNTGHVAPRRKDYHQLMRRYTIVPIFFVHDLIPIDYPEYCSPGEAARHREKIDFILQHAASIIVNSNATLQSLRAYAPHLPKTEVAWLASNLKMIPNTQAPLKKPYFVMHSTIEPRKNHLLILHVWRNLSQKLGKNAPHLFVIGKRGWECEQVLDMLERSTHLRETMTELNQCSDEDLAIFIKHARAVLMPSFAEGFGLGLVEALSFNVPVIASDLPVFREIAGDIPDYLDPLDGLGWERLIDAYTKLDSTVREAQLRRLQSYKPPSWEEHFQKVDQLLT